MSFETDCQNSEAIHNAIDAVLRVIIERKWHSATKSGPPWTGWDGVSGDRALADLLVAPDSRAIDDAKRLIADPVEQALFMAIREMGEKLEALRKTRVWAIVPTAQFLDENARGIARMASQDIDKRLAILDTWWSGIGE